MSHEDKSTVYDDRVMIPKLMTITQLCDYIGITTRAYYVMRDNGSMPPAIYISARTIRFSVEDVQNWLAERTVGGAQ